MSTDTSLLVDGKLVVVKVSYEGIIVDTYDEDGNEFIGSPLALTWDELLPEEDEEESD